MKKLALFGLLILVAIMIVGGTTNPAVAQDDPTILLKIAKNAQDQIRTHVSDNPSDEVKRLFEEGSTQVDALNKAIANNANESAKKHFLYAMKNFKEISQMLTQNDSARAEIVTSKTPDSNLTSDLIKLHRYASSLKAISDRYQTSIDFTNLNNLFATAKEQITSKQFADAHETINQIKQAVGEIKHQLNNHALQKEPERAKKYAQQYLEQLDRLIESAKNQGVPNNITAKLENAKEMLFLASDPEDIVKEIRKIISIKNQFELTKNDKLELKIIQVEKTLVRLSQGDQVNPEIIEDAKENLQQIKYLLSEGKLEQATILLKDLTDQLKKITQSFS